MSAANLLGCGIMLALYLCLFRLMAGGWKMAVSATAITAASFAVAGFALYLVLIP